MEEGEQEEKEENLEEREHEHKQETWRRESMSISRKLGGGRA